MARNIVTNAQVNLNVDGSNAEKKIEGLKTRLKAIKSQMDALRDAGKDNKDPQLRALQKQWEALDKQLKKCQTDAHKVESALKNLDKATPKELNDALRILKRELNSIERGSEAWNKQTQKIRLLQQQISQVNAEMRTSESRFERFNKWLNDSQTLIMGVAAAVTGLVMAGRKAVQSFAEMEQEMANVRKYTGMGEAEIVSLNEQFKNLDTRSGRDELNKLAQDAGRLGKQSQQDVMGFVRAADKINVALDDLGDGATLTLSKLTGIFGDEKRLGTERALLSVGSVINELSQNCSASAPYIAKFASRMGGVAAQAGMTVQQVMALGAVLDTTNQGVEAASTAVAQVITRLYQDTAKYAKVAGLDLKEFSALLKSDANAAFIQFLETLNKAGGMDVLSPMFADMGENGARAIAALSSLAEHIDEVKEQQIVANEAFAEATSIDKEFQVQNTTVLAQMDKARKNVSELAISLGEKLMPVMKYVYSSSSLFLRVLSSIINFILNNSKAIITLTAAIVAYNVAARMATIRTAGFTAAQTLASVAVKAWRAAVLLGNAALSLMTLNVGKATVAWRAFCMAIKANPIGLLVSVITAAVTALIAFRSKTDECSKAMDDAMKSSTSFTEQAARERKEIDKLFGALEGAEKGTKEYDNAKKAIISRYGIYLKGLIDEKGEITNLALAYDRLAFAATKSAQARGINAAREALDDAYFKEIDNLTEKLRSSLEEMGMDDRRSARIITRVSQALAAGTKIPSSVASEINSFQYNHMGFWQSAFGDKPSKIIDEIYRRQNDYVKRSEKLEKMNTRFFESMENEELDRQIEYLSEQLKEMPREAISVSFSVADKETADRIAETIYQRAGNEGLLAKTKSPASLPDRKGFPGVLTLASPISGEAGSLSIFNIATIPMADAGRSASGILNRKEAEKLLRELLYERSARGGAYEDRQAPDADAFSNPYSSSKDADKEKRKQEAEAKREAAKRKAEFREGLAAIRAAYEKQEALLIASYASGQSSYLSYLKERNDNEVRYYDDSRAFYEQYFSSIKDAYVEDDKDYQNLLRKKEEALQKYNDKRIAYEVNMIKRSENLQIKKANADAKSADERSLEDEQELQQKITDIKLESLRQQQSLYASGTEQWEKLQMQIEDLRQDSMFERERLYQEKVLEMRRKYDKLSAAQRFEMETNVLDVLLKNEKISLEEYQKWLGQIAKKYSKQLPGSNYRKSKEEQEKERQEERERQLKEIDDAVNSGMITEDEGKRRKKALDDDDWKSAIDGIRSCGNEWVSMIANVADSWKGLWDAIASGSDDILDNVAKAAAATFAGVTAAMQMASEFAQANAKIEIAAIEKRYDREIELAQGNSYITKKLESEKQKKISEIKNKASEASFRMQIIQATAQMIQGAINAYSSTAAIPLIGPALAPAAAAVALAAGAANIALLTKQQEAAKAQGYSKGGYTPDGRRDDVAGVVHAGEWVASQSLLRRPAAAAVIERLEKVQRMGAALSDADVSRVLGFEASARKSAVDAGVASNVVGMLSQEDASRIVATGAMIRAAGAADRTAARMESMRSAYTSPHDSPSGDDRALLRDLSVVIDRLRRRLDEPFVTVNSVTGPEGIKKANDEYNRMLYNRKLKR